MRDTYEAPGEVRFHYMLGLLSKEDLPEAYRRVVDWSPPDPPWKPVIAPVYTPNLAPWTTNPPEVRTAWLAMQNLQPPARVRSMKGLTRLIKAMFGDAARIRWSLPPHMVARAHRARGWS